MIFLKTGLRLMMKVGDAVRFKKTGRIGLVVDCFRRCIPDGNPNGDFNIEYRYKIACGEDIVNIPRSNFYNVLEVIQ